MDSNVSARQYNIITTANLHKLLPSLAFPMIINMLVTSLYNMADTYFVSHLGTAAAAAVGIVFAIQSVIQAAGFGLGMGVGSLISLALGRKEDELAEKYASSAIAAAVAVGLTVALVGCLNIKGIMFIFGSNEEIMPFACKYGFYILLGAPIMCSSFVLTNILRSGGKPRLSMIGMSAGTVINIVLDPIFIFDFGFGLGIEGAAIATLCGQIISFFFLLSFFVFKKSTVSLSLRCISTNPHDYAKIVLTGFPTVCRQGMASVGTTVLNLKMRVYGSAAIAAMTISVKIYLVIRNIVIGIGQGFQPIAGYNFGAKKYARVRESFWIAVLYGTAFCIVACVFLYIKAPLLMGLFRSDDAAVMSAGTQMLHFFALSVPFMAYSTFVNQMYQCLGFVKWATFLASLRNGIIFIPLMFLLPIFLGLTGAELAQPLADILTFVVSVPFQILFVRRVLEKN